MGNLFVSYENILSLFILFFILFFFIIVLLKRRKCIKICNVFYVQWRRVKAYIFLIYCVFTVFYDVECSIQTKLKKILLCSILMFIFLFMFSFFFFILFFIF